MYRLSGGSSEEGFRRYSKTLLYISFLTSNFLKLGNLASVALTLQSV